jgi:hypothetical protein
MVNPTKPRKTALRHPSSSNKPGSGALIRKLLKTTKLSHKEIAAQVQATFPGSQVDDKGVAWMKWAVKNGKIPA